MIRPRSSAANHGAGPTVITRRSLLTSAASLGLVGWVSTAASEGNEGDARLSSKSLARQRGKGLLLGSAIGDALGGPIEFRESEAVADWVIDCRGWSDDRRLSSTDLRAFAKSLRLRPYSRFRPQPEPYGQWTLNAAPGTITDDTRHKMVLVNALNRAIEDESLPIDASDLAAAYLSYAEDPAIVARPAYGQLCEESFREFNRAARWVLGERKTEVAAPPARIWGGTPTCCGQMAMLPLALVYADRPVDAYKASYALSFMDVGTAKDINSSIVAGLSVALSLPQPRSRDSCRDEWRAIVNAMKATDPFRYREVPFVTRPVNAWLDFAEQMAKQAAGSPKQLYQILVEQGQVKYFWESHFILALVCSTLMFCDYHPLAALAMLLDFGHDTDSGAQLLGAFVGALYGPDIFSEHLKQPVIERLAADYDISIDAWTDLLGRLHEGGANLDIVRVR